LSPAWQSSNIQARSDASSLSIEDQFDTEGFVDPSGLVLQSVELILMNVYELRSNGQAVLAVEIDTMSWLPVRPRIRIGWLRFLVSSALRRHFRESAAVVKA